MAYPDDSLTFSHNLLSIGLLILLIMRIILYLLFYGFCPSAIAQNTMGIPDIINYSKQAYKAGTQSWDVKQDGNGILYFANNDGLLSFDGHYWKTLHLPTKTHLRSIEIGADNRIYTGSQDDVGYFSPSENGELKYHSLKHLLPPAEQSFNEVWDIVIYEGDIFFRSDVKILQLKNNRFIVHKPLSQWRYLGLSNGLLLAQDRSKGLYKFTGEKWEPLVGAASFPPDLYVSGLLPFGKDSSLLVTTKAGLFVLSGSRATSLHSPDLEKISRELISSACLISNELIVLSTRLNGCYIITRDGKIINHFSIKEGLQNNNIYSLFSDRSNNLWLCLDNGIDFIAYDNAIKHIYPAADRNGSGYASAIYKNALYLGCSNGLFRSPLSAGKDLSFERAAFGPVANTGGQVWNLTEINGQLLMGHHEGAFIVKDYTANLLSSWTGFWTFKPISNFPPSQVIVGGNYRGISFFTYENQQFRNIDSNLLIESSRFLVIDNDRKTVWVGHPYKGLYKLNWNSRNEVQVKHYTPENAPLGINNNFLFHIRNGIVLTTETGTYEYNNKTDVFEPSAFFNQVTGKMPLSYLQEDSSGNIWFVSGSTMGVIVMSGKKPQVVFFPELDHKLVAGFEHINPIDASNILVGGEKGFYHIDFKKYRENKKDSIQVHLSVVQALGTKDSLLFGGFYQRFTDSRQATKDPPIIPHNNNSFHFEYSCTLYGQQENVEFSYKLKGFDNQWSEWTRKTEKDYTNLPAGAYTFMIKCRNGEAGESPVRSYPFKVLPPWYQTWWAWLLLTLLLAVCFGILNQFQKKKFLQQQKETLRRQKHEYEEESNRLLYLHQLEIEKNEKEIIRLKNEKLQAQLESKNSELAGNAMSLVQKSELLSRIKEQLILLRQDAGSDTASKEFKKVINTINKELEISNDWEQFSVHFDEVHTNFLTQLKKNYPDLTSSELKLCAYLRLNLSTKEIAQLMNISVRGVETSRYRVRKKLNLTAEKNLINALFEAGNSDDTKLAEDV